MNRMKSGRTSQGYQYVRDESADVTRLPGYFISPCKHLQVDKGTCHAHVFPKAAPRLMTLLCQLKFNLFEGRH